MRLAETSANTARLQGKSGAEQVQITRLAYLKDTSTPSAALSAVLIATARDSNFRPQTWARRSQ